MPRKVTDHCRLALLGLACGDCFGAPFEYHPEAPRLAELSIREGRYLDAVKDVGQRPHRCRLPGMYTDDTQQALALITAWLETDTPEDATAHFFGICEDMASHIVKGAPFGLHRGTGGNFRQAIMTGHAVDTAGLGAPMRVGPVATLFDDPQKMIEWILCVSTATTTSPISLACTAKFAAFAWALSHPDEKYRIRDVDWPGKFAASEVWAATTAALRVMRQEGEEPLLAFAEMLGWSNKHMTCAANGFALTGVPWVVSHGVTAKSFEDALVGVCSSGGDTDTVAAMAGCLAALKHGEDNIPFWMTDQLEGLAHIKEPEHWKWLEDEKRLTEADTKYRLGVMQDVYKANKSRKRQDTIREELDLFDMAAEAHAEEEAEVNPDPGPVLFYGKTKHPEYWPFSNFYPAAFILDGEEWPDTEHPYMAAKSPDDPEYQQAIRDAKTPQEAKRRGRQCKLRSDWEQVKADIMFRCLRAKFDQNPELRKLLLSTGDRDIHEDCRDLEWGGGPNFPDGRDLLGQVLMDVRDLLRGGG